MATGKRAFDGDSVAILHDAILHSVPIPVHEANPKLPPKLQQIIGRALKKDRNERYQSALEMRLELEASERADAATESFASSDRGSGDQAKGIRRTRKGWRFLHWLMPSLAVIAVGAGVAWFVLRPVPPPRISEFRQITFDGLPKELFGTDGSRLYLRDFQEAGIRQMAVSSGVSQPIPIAPSEVEWSSISRDGSRLLVGPNFRDDKPEVPISIVQTSGGTARHLANGVSAAWAPDGNSVVYSTADGYVNLVRSDGTGNHRLAHVTAGTSYGLSWSPDGKTIRFFVNARLWEISSDGIGLHEVLDDWSNSRYLCCGQWTPDGKFFVFQGTETKDGDQTFQIFALDERRRLFSRRRTKMVELTTGPIPWTTPIPSKDGTKIFAVGGTNQMGLVRFNSKSKRLEPYLGGISAQFVSFSRDGKSVAFLSVRDFTLWKANRDGSKPVQLCGWPSIYATQPRWSPDGSQLLFTSMLDGQYRAYVISSSGGSPQLLLPDDSGRQDDPDWSPDGRKIVFARNGRNGNRSIIQIFDATSHQLKTLQGSDGFAFPRWSPDARLILAQSDDRRSLKIFNLETTTESVFRINKPTFFPSWSRDGQFIYLEIYEGKPGVFRISLKGGEPEMVVDLKDVQQVIGDGGKWLALDPSDAPLLLRNEGTSDIYALTLEN